MMGDVVTVCDICGDEGLEEFLAICNKCTEGAEHIYCTADKLDKVPEGDWWMCEDCKKSECQNSKSPVNLESSSSSKFKFKSSHAWKRQTKGSPLLKSKFEGQLAKVGYLPKQNVEKNIVIYDTRKGKNLGLLSKSVSFDNASSVKLNGTCSDVIVANDYRLVVFKNSSSADETKATKRKYVSGVAAEKSENITISRNETSISGPNCYRLDAVQSCGQVDRRLQPNCYKAHKDLNCLNKDKKKESWQAEQPTEAATAMKLHEFCTCLGSDKKSQFEAATLSEEFSIPNLDYKWQGKFQIHRDGITSSCVGIQAHVSTYASEEVLAVVDRLPDIIVLEELPRLKMWPSQFIESQATEENISLYFFAKDLYRGLIEYMSKNDLALKGNFDGVELLIFPSNVLPEKSQDWNKLLFLWGVFREYKIDDSANTPVSNSPRQKNRDIVSSQALDPDANQDGINMVEVHEIEEFDAMDTRSSGDRILIGGDNYNSGCSESRQSLDGEKETPESVVDLNISPWTESATPDDGPCMSVENAGDKPSKDVKGKMPMEENISADHAKLHGKLQMDEKNNADRAESSKQPSLSCASPTSYEENLDLLHWLAAETLLSFSNGLRKI